MTGPAGKASDEEATRLQQLKGKGKAVEQEEEEDDDADEDEEDFDEVAANPECSPETQSIAQMLYCLSDAVQTLAPDHRLTFLKPSCLH